MLIDRTEELKLFDDNDMTNGRDVDRRACVIDRLANRTDADAMVKGEEVCYACPSVSEITDACYANQSFVSFLFLKGGGGECGMTYKLGGML